MPVMFIGGALLVLQVTQQPSLPKLVGPAAWKASDEVLAGTATVRPIVRRALATYVEASQAYRAADFRRCKSILDELWQFRSIGDAQWQRAAAPDASYFMGFPAVYPALLMLDEACNWRLNPSSQNSKPHPIVMAVLLFGRSEGKQALTKKELASGGGSLVKHQLDPVLLVNNYARIKNATWLFQEYLEAITFGKARLELDFYSFPDESVQMYTSTDKNAPETSGFASPIHETLNDQVARLRSRLERQPDWYWAIMPSHVPDGAPEFSKMDFITGGNNAGPDGRSLKLDCDDKLLTMRPRLFGRGPYSPLEAEVAMPYWLGHEFYHHVFGRFGELHLEDKPHIYFDKTKWPADFQGVTEPDYYREALHKRIQKSNLPLNLRLRYAPPPKEYLNSLKVKDLVGSYRQNPYKNPWSEGRLAYEGTDDHGNPVLTWRNEGGASWSVFPTSGSLAAPTGQGNPYTGARDINANQFLFEFARDDFGRYTKQIAGFWFLNEFYYKL